ncbi:hypothetical protein ACT3SZ_15620 [Corynebacterium sp. AOP40-9SA-29]|uniref:hypothetical protein n=1 Tax=Corynebacterium sp. AOP40-9SA-29 TaxID=3457677 RepID=UPI004034442D
MTTHKSLTTIIDTDHQAGTVTIHNRTLIKDAWDQASPITIPGEWIDRVEQKGGNLTVHLINHANTPLPGDGADRWILPLSRKKRAVEAEQDINTLLAATHGRQQRPFSVPQPLGKTREKTLAAQKRIPGAVAFGGLILVDGVVYAAGQAIPARDAKATVDAGAAAQSKVGAGRVVGGAILAGPVGALIGAAAKKSTGELFITVESTDGRVAIGSGPSKESSSATTLANAINAAQ